MSADPNVNEAAIEREHQLREDIRAAATEERRAEDIKLPPVTDALPPVVYDGPVKRRPAVLDWDQEYQRLVKLTVLRPKNREATGAELAMFAEQVQRSGLDPFFNQIYGIYRYDKRVKDEVMQVQAGIDGFRLVAERTGKYEGQTPQQWCGKDGVWRDVWASDEHPFAARVGVYKRGRREPTYAVAHWSEYVQTHEGKPIGLWGSMSRNQLSKCAEALALRKAFPNELSGLYVPEEMGQADNPADDLTATDSTAVEVDEPLPPAVEEVLTRAILLDHRGIANRATAAMAVRDQPSEVVEAKVRAWTAELDRMEAEARKRDLSPDPAQVGEDTGEAPDASEAPAEAGEADESLATLTATDEPSAITGATPEDWTGTSDIRADLQAARDATPGQTDMDLEP